MKKNSEKIKKISVIALILFLCLTPLVALIHTPIAKAEPYATIYYEKVYCYNTLVEGLQHNDVTYLDNPIQPSTDFNVTINIQGMTTLSYALLKLQGDDLTNYLNIEMGYDYGRITTYETGLFGSYFYASVIDWNGEWHFEWHFTEKTLDIYKDGVLLESIDWSVYSGTFDDFSAELTRIYISVQCAGSSPTYETTVNGDLGVGTSTLTFTNYDTHCTSYIDVYYESIPIMLKHEITSSILDVPTNSLIVVYCVADNGYYLNNITINGDDSYISGSNYIVDTDYTIIFNVIAWEFEFDNYVNVTVTLDSIYSTVTTMFNGDNFNLTGTLTPYTYQVPYKTSVGFLYSNNYNTFTFWYLNYTYIEEGDLFTDSETQNSNPYFITKFYLLNEDFREISYWVYPSSIPNGQPTPTPTGQTPTPQPTATPNPDSITSIITGLNNFFFGESGTLGFGFGLIIIGVLSFAFWMFGGKNLYALMLAINIGVIVCVGVGIWELWTLIMIIIVDVGIGISKSGILNDQGDN